MGASCIGKEATSINTLHRSYTEFIVNEANVDFEIDMGASKWTVTTATAKWIAMVFTNRLMHRRHFGM